MNNIEPIDELREALLNGFSKGRDWFRIAECIRNHILKPPVDDDESTVIEYIRGLYQALIIYGDIAGSVVIALRARYPKNRKIQLLLNALELFYFLHDREKRGFSLDGGNAQPPFNLIRLKHYSPVDRNEVFRDDKKIVVLCDTKGIGHLLLLASVFNDILKRSRLHVIVYDKRLLPIFQRSFPEAIIERVPSMNPSGVKDRFEKDDNIILKYYTALYLMRSRCKDFPLNQAPYIFPNRINKELWKARFRGLGDGIKIGISWRTESIEKPEERNAGLDQWRCLFEIPGVHWINLQYGNCVADVEHIKQKFNITIHDWPDADPLMNLDNFTAEIAALDLVISIDNSTVYFSGAQNIPTWMLTMRDMCKAWDACDDTPWVPSLRIFQQDEPGDWAPVFERVAEELRGFIATGTMTPVDPEASYKTAFRLLDGE